MEFREAGFLSEFRKNTEELCNRKDKKALKKACYIQNHINKVKVQNSIAFKRKKYSFEALKINHLHVNYK